MSAQSEEVGRRIDRLEQSCAALTTFLPIAVRALVRSVLAHLFAVLRGLNDGR